MVFNIACTNHQIQHEPEALGEKWMNKYPGGAVASLGATRPSWTLANHDYDKELFHQVFLRNINRLGLISNVAATYIINNHGTYGVDNAKMYLWLGDPATLIWTENPINLDVEHPTALFTGNHLLDITVTKKIDEEDIHSVKNATVCLFKANELYAVGKTATNGTIRFNISLHTRGTLYVTVTKQNYIPYEGEITIIKPIQKKPVPGVR